MLEQIEAIETGLVCFLLIVGVVGQYYSQVIGSKTQVQKTWSGIRVFVHFDIIALCQL